MKKVPLETTMEKISLLPRPDEVTMKIESEKQSDSEKVNPPKG